MVDEPAGTISARHWHAMAANEALRALDSDAARGLTTGEAARRIADIGPNAISERAARGPWAMLAAQFANFMTLVLLGAAVVAGVIGDPVDTIAIVTIVLLNVAIGFAQEYRAERTLAALRRMAAASAMVVRDGHPRLVAATALVPGDIVLLEAGAAVPADLRLIEAHALRLGEAALTGESQPVDKSADAAPVVEAMLGDRVNMLFKGTSVLYGRARAVVVATGMATELGRIAGMLSAAPTVETPLQRRLGALGRQLAMAALAICGMIFLIGLLRGEPPMLMLLTALSLAVAAIPEALPAVVTVLLALGARRMADEKALVRHLPAVETLGSVTYICSDKTGTLTENRMRVMSLYVNGVLVPVERSDAGPGPMPEMLTALALCNDVAPDAADAATGDPTEVALWQAARAAGFDKAAVESRLPRLAELPFDSERRRMTTLHRRGAGFVAYTKGAPEAVLERCACVASANGEEPLDVAAVQAAAEAMAADGQRVLAVAARAWGSQPAMDADAVERDLVLVGLVGMIDPPRPEVAEAVATCKAAGITPVMITGDHPATGWAIARRIGIAGPNDAAGDALLTGRELAALSDRELAARVGETRVYARVDPAQKIRIVSALRARGELVAMTGDGVNDAPALANADIGVAMGLGGTDVARDAASVVLLDDNFATIVSATREGRRIFDNVRKFVRYVLACNSAEIWVIFLAPFLGLPVPLLPIHILWINLVTDGLPGLALAAEPAERDVMRRPPRPPGESILAGGLLRHVVSVGLLMAGVTLGTQAAALAWDLGHWQTMVFCVLTFAQMGQLLAIRSSRDSLFRRGLLSNTPMLLAICSTFVLQLAVVYVPALNDVFRTQPLTAAELLACIGLGSIVFLAVEMEKWWARRGG